MDRHALRRSHVVTTPSAISGNDLVAGDGIIIAALSGVAGLGEVGEPTMPVPDPMPGSYPGRVMWITDAGLVSGHGDMDQPGGGGAGQATSTMVAWRGGMTLYKLLMIWLIINQMVFVVLFELGSDGQGEG
jgi:hypothetical protein